MNQVGPRLSVPDQWVRSARMLWAALDGLVTLGRAGRLRPGYDSDRLQLLVNQFTSRRETMR